VNWSISGSTTSIATAASDGSNVVTFDGTLPSGVLGRATSRFQGSTNGSCNTTNTVWWVDEIDVQFMPDPPVSGFPWNFGPGAPGFSTFDFESVAVHELGHAHGLGHVIQPGTVMHFSLSNGSNARTLGANEINGGNAKMGYSTLPLCLTPAGVSGPMTLFNGGTCSLPLEWLSFSAEPMPDGRHQLSWQMANLEGLQSFDVEHSLDGQQFRKVGNVPASAQKLDYQFDYRPEELGSSHYYRLRNRMLNGQDGHSAVVLVSSQIDAQPRVLPTIFDDQIQITNPGTKALECRIYDLGGKVVWLQVLAPGKRVAINSQQWASGMYFYRLQSEGANLSGKLVKQ
jgi:hypothetical protein